MASAYRTHDFAFDQGDLLEAVPFTLETDSGHQVIRLAGVVTSHGCDCERLDRAELEDPARASLRVHVAPLILVSDLPAGGMLGDIRAGRVRRYYAMPIEDRVPEYVVDFWYEQPIHPEKLVALKRIASLEQEEWIKMMIQLFVGRVHKDPKDIFKDSQEDTAS